MAEFRTDNGGLAFHCADMKLMSGASTWATRLSNLAYQDGAVRILTSRLYDLDYIGTQLNRRPRNISLLVDRVDAPSAQWVKENFPSVDVALGRNIGMNAVSTAPLTLFLSSEPFGRRKWDDLTVGMHSKTLHDYFVREVFMPLWEKAEKL